MLHTATKKHSTHHHSQRHARIFALLSWLNWLGNGAFWAIFPLVILELAGTESKVWLYYSLIAGILFLASIGSTFVYTRFSKLVITKIVLIVAVVSFLLMTFASTFYQLWWLDILRAIAICFIWISINLFISDYTHQRHLWEVEGKIYLYSNIGWVIWPIIWWLLAGYFSPDAVFIFSSICFLWSLLVFLHGRFVDKHPHLTHTRYEHWFIRLFTTFKDYFSQTDRIIVFLMALWLNFWWSISFIYIPIQLSSFGFGENIIWLVFGANILPLMLLEWTIGKRADRYWLQRFFLVWYMILTIGCVWLMITSTVPFLLIALFILVHIGVACIEPLQETFLFKSINKKDTGRFFGIYNTADPIANVCGPLFAAGVLALSYNSIPVLRWVSWIIFLGFVAAALQVKK